MTAEARIAPTGYFLDSLLAPLSPWLELGDVTDIYINRAQEVWVETLGGVIETHACEALSEPVLARMARQIAAVSAQGINREHPLLAATLPDGSRVQVAAPPATRAGHVMAIRRHVAAKLTLEDYDDSGAFDEAAMTGVDLDQARRLVPVAPQDVRKTLSEAVRAKRNILISGGTSTGKTTFLNALLRETPAEERLVLIEDTPELDMTHTNAVGLLAARGELGEAAVDSEDLLMAALRLRPDRIILGELRGREAFTFLRTINTGHPGSMTTIHADDPTRAIEQLALLVLQAGTGLSRDEVRHYVRASIDVFVQLDRRAGRRKVAQVLARS